MNLFENSENNFHLGFYLFPGIAIGLCQEHGLCLWEVDVRVLFNRFESDLVKNLHDAGKNTTRHGLKNGLSRILQFGIGGHSGHRMAG